MSTPFLEALVANYQWPLSIYAAVGIAAVTFLGKRLLLLVPTFQEARRLNEDARQMKMDRPSYAANQKWNRKWGLICYAAIFGLILPFCITLEAQAWWNVLLDVVVIMLFYDFFYYLVHRFLFHDNGFLGGPLLWVHAVHHRQHNPCRMDLSYIHPLEVALGLGLYVGSILILSRFMGEFHLATIVITWVAFSQINLHNHDLWETERFPFRYLNYMSKMHHNHHAKFTGGNYATISLLYDWLFGTLDNGEVYDTKTKSQPARESIPSRNRS